MNLRKIFYLVVVLFVQYVSGVFEFPDVEEFIPSDQMRDRLYNYKKSKLNAATTVGMFKFQQEKSLEVNLIKSGITIKNGTLSHAGYIATSSNKEVQDDDKIATKILKSSLFILNSECLPNNIDKNICVDLFSNVPVPKSSTLSKQCLQVIRKYKNNTHYEFRRLLPAKYKDGFYKIYHSKNLPSPRMITNLFMNQDSGNHDKDRDRNLVLVQWAQFIEHDLSKSVATTMRNGKPIECCSSDFYKLSPRHVHPACAPLYGVEEKYYKKTCFNYVRSALTVGEKCNFGAAKQVNQATGILDLSQLYGLTEESQHMMRSFKNGQLKTSKGENEKKAFLPIAENPFEFCVDVYPNTTNNCFMAGDTRVNINPFAITLYTIFLRNHNAIAQKLQKKNSSFTDDEIYIRAKRINIKIYENIIYKEWLPIILGEYLANLVNTKSFDNYGSDSFGTSNEFGLAAIRFYYSMMPNSLTKEVPKKPLKGSVTTANSKNYIPKEVFNVSEEFFKSNFLSNPNQLNIALNSMLNQNALKMDSNYADSFTKKFFRTSLSAENINGSDALAWDIQRGRDHGVQSYVKYLEVCYNVEIKDWFDLRRFIDVEQIEILKKIYNSFTDIDLIVGGLSESQVNGATVGSTFACILGEQFSNILRWQNSLDKTTVTWEEPISAARLLCDTTSLKSVPANIFLIPSKKNLLVRCSRV